MVPERFKISRAWTAYVHKHVIYLFWRAYANTISKIMSNIDLFVGFKMDIKIIGLTLVSAVLGSIGQINFKIGADNLQLTNVLSIIKNYNLIIGILFYLISTIIYIYVLKFSQLTMVYPIIATSYIWTALLSNIILNESISLVNIIGYFLILFGINLAITK
jgi:uncharacterized membrane protein